MRTSRSFGQFGAAALLGVSVLVPLGIFLSAFPASATTVACSTTTLISDLSIATANETLSLAMGCPYTLSTVDNTANGPTGLPKIAVPITIQGNGATITRSTGSGTPDFRIFDVESTVSLDDLTISNGEADGTNNAPDQEGGGVYVGNGGKLTVSQSTFADNDATFSGGAIDVASDGNTGSLNVSASTFFKNGDATSNLDGGAIDIGDDGGTGTGSVTDSTFVDNSGSDGGAIAAFTPGSGTLTVSQDTISGSTGGGIDTDLDTGVTLTATILAGNDFNCGGFGTVIDGGNNLESASDCSLKDASSLYNTDPKLAPLASNGGPTQTQALLARSQAIDHVADTTLCSVPDQRGAIRSSPCDIGAYDTDGNVSISSANATTFTVGTAGNFTVTTTGKPVPALSESGDTLPQGVSFTDNGNGTASLSGTPASGTGDTYIFTITASSASAPMVQQTFTLTVDEAPSITSPNSATFTTGQSGTFTITSTGFPADATIGVSGTVPLGLTFTPNSDGTATLAGTPHANTGGSYPLTITASNGIAPAAQQSFTVVVDQAPAITSGSSASFTVGEPGMFTVTTSGFPKKGVMTITPSAGLPNGVSLNDNGDGTADLEGTPAAGDEGPYSFTITAGNGVGTAAQQSFVLTVLPVITLSPATLPNGTPGVRYSVTLVVAGGAAPYSFSAIGALPAGLSLNASTGVISGVPTGNGTSPFTVTVTDADHFSVQKGYSIDICGGRFRSC